jgi:steroid 5-alpha reductase family enzyme
VLLFKVHGPESIVKSSEHFLIIRVVSPRTMSFAFLRAPGLISSLCISFGAQFTAYTYSTLGRTTPTEHYYDLSGSLTHLALVAHAVGTSAAHNGGALNPRVVLMGTLSSLWAMRLGYYLFDRVSRTGGDTRFDELKKDSRTWCIPWIFQAIWCWALEAPLAMVAAASLSSSSSRLTRWDGVGVAIFLGGFAWECLADSQKDQFKRLHPTAPMTEGLFRYSVYANYFGEVALWCGMTLIAFPATIGRPLPYTLLATLPPVFSAYLLWRVSGIPLSEANSWRKYGGNPEYINYRARTSLFFPWPQDQIASIEKIATANAAAKKAISTKGGKETKNK